MFLLILIDKELPIDVFDWKINLFSHGIVYNSQIIIIHTPKWKDKIRFITSLVTFCFPQFVRVSRSPTLSATTDILQVHKTH